MAAEKQSTVARLALAWLLHQSAVSTVIIGAKKMEQLEDNLKAIDVKFTGPELKRLDEWNFGKLGILILQASGMKTAPISVLH